MTVEITDEFTASVLVVMENDQKTHTECLGIARAFVGAVWPETEGWDAPELKIKRAREIGGSIKVSVISLRLSYLKYRVPADSLQDSLWMTLVENIDDVQLGLFWLDVLADR